MNRRRFVYIGSALLLITVAAAAYLHLSSPIRTYEKIYLGMPRAEADALLRPSGADALLRPRFSTSEPKVSGPTRTLHKEGEQSPVAEMWHCDAYMIFISFEPGGCVTGKFLISLEPSLFDRVRAWLGL